MKTLYALDFKSPITGEALSVLVRQNGLYFEVSLLNGAREELQHRVEATIGSAHFIAWMFRAAILAPQKARS